MTVADKPYPSIRGRIDWRAMRALSEERKAEYPDDPDEWWVRTDEPVSPSTVTQVKHGMVRALKDYQKFEFTTRAYPNHPYLKRAAWVYLRPRP